MQPRLLILWAHSRSRSSIFCDLIQGRGDFVVIHEPFCTLHETGRVEIPDGSGGMLTLASQSALIDGLRTIASRKPVFFKESCDHRYLGVEARPDFLAEADHAFLVRDPRATIAAHYDSNPNVSCAEIGYEHLYRMYEAVCAATGVEPPVVDSDQLVTASRHVLRAFCARLGLTFDGAAPASVAQTEPSGLRAVPSDSDQDVSDQGASHQNNGAREAPGQSKHRFHTTVDNDARLHRYYEHHAPYYRALAQACLS